MPVEKLERIRKAEKEAEERVREARKRAGDLVREALEQSDGLKASKAGEARKKAERFLKKAEDDARVEAEGIKKQMQAQAGRLIEEARSSKDKAVEAVLKRIST